MKKQPKKNLKVTLKVRVGSADTHYAGGLASGAFVMGLFADAATEILVRSDGDEGLFRAYKDVEFLEPVRAGDFIEVTAKLTGIGFSSRQMTFEAHKVIEGSLSSARPTKAKALKNPLLVARAKGTCVVKRD